jgi:hypothetical protein
MIVENGNGTEHDVQLVKFTDGTFGIQDYIDGDNWLVCDAADPENPDDRYEIRVQVYMGQTTLNHGGEWEVVDGPVPDWVRESLAAYSESLTLAA